MEAVQCPWCFQQLGKIFMLRDGPSKCVLLQRTHCSIHLLIGSLPCQMYVCPSMEVNRHLCMFVSSVEVNLCSWLRTVPINLQRDCILVSWLDHFAAWYYVTTLQVLQQPDTSRRFGRTASKVLAVCGQGAPGSQPAARFNFAVNDTDADGNRWFSTKVSPFP